MQVLIDLRRVAECFTARGEYTHFIYNITYTYSYIYSWIFWHKYLTKICAFINMKNTHFINLSYNVQYVSREDGSGLYICMSEMF